MNIKHLFILMLMILSVPFWSKNNLSSKTTMQERIAYWQSQKVIFDISDTVYLEENISIGFGSRIGAGVYLTGSTILGNNVTIGPYSVIDNATLGDNVQIHSHSVIRNSTLEDNTQAGPFAHIHKNSHIQCESKIGNFVEVSQSTIGKKTKAYHLTLLEHATVGNQVNIGGGTITSDYDGKNKHQTIIKDKVFVGSNNTLIAPVTLEKECFTAAGSVITKDVPAHALGIGRARQINKEKYAEKLLYHPKDIAQ